MAVSAAQKKQLLDKAASLQARGMAALAKAPAPLRRALSGTSVQFRSEGGPTQSIAAPQSHDANLAGVVANDPRTINVMDQQAFQKAPEQLTVHEGMHLWQNSLPPSIQASIPADNPNNPYQVPSTDDVAKLLQRGKTILALPKESQSATLQKYQADGGDQSAPQAERDTYGKLAQTMDAIPQSTIQGTDPDAAELNTTPRAPLPPANALQPATKIYPEKKDEGAKKPVDISGGLVKKAEGYRGKGKVVAFDEATHLPVVRHPGTTVSVAAIEPKESAAKPAETKSATETKSEPGNKSAAKSEEKPAADPPAASNSATSNDVAKPEVKPAKSDDKPADKAPTKPEDKPKKAGTSFGSMLAKGQMVHLTNGIKGVVQYNIAPMRTVRIKTADNHNMIVRHSQIAAVEDGKNDRNRSAEQAATT